MDVVDGFIHAWNVADGSAIADLLAGGANWIDMTRERELTATEVRGYLRGIHAAAPAITVRPISALRSEDGASVEVEISGEDTEGLCLVQNKPTGRVFTLRIAGFLTIRNEAVTEYRIYWNLAGLLKQLGIHWLTSDTDWRMTEALRWNR